MVFVKSQKCSQCVDKMAEGMEPCDGRSGMYRPKHSLCVCVPGVATVVSSLRVRELLVRTLSAVES